jgi:hypothetical protein
MNHAGHGELGDIELSVFSVRSAVNLSFHPRSADGA